MERWLGGILGKEEGKAKGRKKERGIGSTDSIGRGREMGRMEIELEERAVKQADRL